ncbi:helix-turn-helix transcriptional regulator [Tianweitania sp. BSSL-BM11]|uniref:Helix-turn-helix transcriptional regulator n=1 Tax=Tianweitania aestuarii TaxID=2814886 RepID=A0ABS5RVP7_9HYPH|nr:metalloregulator ArsR/SmtB family transcription factor [Tianweitania aestuarii]MBS9721123.1 helix-turn-helix transcriptional regulator [Tianweitania aestuarii]
MERADEIAALLSMLGNTKRLLIMCHLREGEMSVGKIAESVQLSQSALSQHLAKLRQLQLVETRRDKQTIYYSLSSPVTRNLLSTLEELYKDKRGASHGDKASAATV